jgi:hypothetical protein
VTAYGAGLTGSALTGPSPCQRLRSANSEAEEQADRAGFRDVASSKRGDLHAHSFHRAVSVSVPRDGSRLIPGDLEANQK